MVFFTDLDNTLIYSYKHELPKDKICVEIYKEKDLSFMTKKSYELLKELNNELFIVPLTTRTIEQFQRIHLSITPKYSLVCNGGLLLIDGKSDKEWYEESLRLIKDSVSDLEKSISLLENEDNRYFEIRFIENLFVFTKCKNPESVVENLKDKLKSETVNVFNNGDKIYVVPTNLSKGCAVERFTKCICKDKTIAAGDSEFDISMLDSVDIGLCPFGFIENYKVQTKDLIEMDNTDIFSDSLLDYIKANCIN